MPNVLDYLVHAGYMKGTLMAAATLSQQRTLGGGDIRRQDAPFVSNRLNASKVGAMLMYPLPKLQELRRHVDQGTREELAIANKWTDGPSTPTPPGHWNFLAAPYIRRAEFSEVRAARAFALLNMALHDAAVACWETKYFYFNPRPSHLDPDLRTVIGLPNFPSYTSGHSTFSGAAAEVLSYLFPGDAAYFEAQKEEASISRLYGGIHYRSDLEEGKAHGKRIGGYTVRFAMTDGAGVP